MTDAIMETILNRLALLFIVGANGDEAAARHAAARMLACYKTETEDELAVAAEIVSFGFHALEALSLACTPEMSLTKVCRLRGSAVSLSREKNKARDRLGKMQAARRAGAPAEKPEAASPKAEKAINLITETREIVAKAPNMPWPQAVNHHQHEKRLIAQAVKAPPAVNVPSSSAGAARRTDATPVHPLTPAAQPLAS